MCGRLVDSIEPFLLAAQGRTLEGRLDIGSLERLQTMIQSSEGEVGYVLHFGRDESGIPCVNGHVEASTLVLQCQRCMQDMVYPVGAEVHLGIVKSRSAAEQLPTNYDPLLVVEKEISLTSMVEDELILALPLVAMHRPEDCAMGNLVLSQAGQGKKEQTTEPDKRNPFAILATLKEQINSDGTPESTINDED